MSDYRKLVSDDSSFVSEYIKAYSYGTNQLATLQRELDLVYEQSGFSKLQKMLTSDAFIEYQEQMRFISRIYDNIKPALAAISFVALPKTVNIGGDQLKKTTSSISHDYILSDTDSPRKIERTGSNSKQASRNTQEYGSMMQDTVVIPASLGKWFTVSLLQKMLDDDFVAGETSVSEKYIAEVAAEFGWLTTMNWLNSIYLDNYSNAEILIGLMHCISHFEFVNVKPAGPTMALGVLQHEDDYVRDYAVRAFENWNDKEAIPILESLSCEAEWLRDYIDQVIAALKSEFEQE